MGEFKKTKIINFNRSGAPPTADNLYWEQLDFPVTVKEYGAVTSIDFSPAEPHYFAVSCSTKVQLYDPQSNEVHCSLTRFKKAAYGASFRNDGKLVVAGGEEGPVSLFSVETKSRLRLFKGHLSAVHCAKFLPDGYRIVSFSDDQTICCWDVPTEKQICCLEGHKDNVRTGCVGRADVIASGSYDHSVCLWDTRDASLIHSFDHGYPVEALLMFPNESVLISAGGTVVKFWDLIAHRQLAQLSQHHKTVTCLTFCSNYRRFISASLDRHAKIYDTASYRVVHTLDFPSSVLAIGIGLDDSVLATGMADGLLSIQHRKTPKETPPYKMRTRSMSYRFMIGASDNVRTDFVVKWRNPDGMPYYDRLLRNFQHSKALDSAFASRRKPEVIVSLFQELMRRGALKKALAGRNPDSLKQILSFLSKNFNRLEFIITLSDVINALLDIYGSKLGSLEPQLLQQFKKLQAAVSVEAVQLKSMAVTLGSMDLILAQSEPGAKPEPSQPLPDVRRPEASKK